MKMHSRKLWLTMGVLAVMLGSSIWCMTVIARGDNPGLITLAGKLIDSVTTITLGYLGANVLGKAEGAIRALKGTPSTPPTETAT